MITENVPGPDFAEPVSNFVRESILVTGVSRAPHLIDAADQRKCIVEPVQIAVKVGDETDAHARFPKSESRRWYWVRRFAARTARSLHRQWSADDIGQLLLRSDRVPSAGPDELLNHQ